MGAAVTSQNRGGTEPPSDSVSAARLAMAELLLFSEDPVECARATVDWLVERGGARKALCALIETESGTLQDVAASGVPEGQLEALHLAPEQPDPPLAFAPAGRRPVSPDPPGRRH